MASFFEVEINDVRPTILDDVVSFLSVKPDVFVHSHAFYLDETRI